MKIKLNEFLTGESTALSTIRNRSVTYFPHHTSHAHFPEECDSFTAVSFLCPGGVFIINYNQIVRDSREGNKSKE